MLAPKDGQYMSMHPPNFALDVLLFVERMTQNPVFLCFDWILRGETQNPLYFWALIGWWEEDTESCILCSDWLVRGRHRILGFFPLFSFLIGWWEEETRFGAFCFFLCSDWLNEMTSEDVRGMVPARGSISPCLWVRVLFHRHTWKKSTLFRQRSCTQPDQ